MTREQAGAALKKYGGQRAAAAAMKVSRKTLRKAMAGDGKPAAALAAKPIAKARTLTEFRAQYDKGYIVPARVKDALKRLGASGWEYEVDFAKLAGVALADLGRFRDQFADFVVAIGRDSRRAWAGSKATANAMREMLS
jgi:hypothetical protein